MPGFWDYFQQMAQQNNEKLNTLYERQFNLANMMSQQSQNQMSNMLALGQLKSANLGKQIDIMDNSMNRGLQRDRMTLDEKMNNANNAVSYARIAADREMEQSRQKFQYDMAVLEDQLKRGQISLENANARAAELRQQQQQQEHGQQRRPHQGADGRVKAGSTHHIREPRRSP